MAYSNPRYAAFPAERMRGCSFADNFVDRDHSEDYNGADFGAFPPTVTGRRVKSNGFGYVEYDIVSQPGSFSVKVKILCDNTSSKGVIIANADIASIIDDGFSIWADGSGIKANHSDGVDDNTECAVDLDYDDGEIHTITYVVDKDEGAHTLYVDALSDTQDTVTTGTTGASNNIRVMGWGSIDNIFGVSVFGLFAYIIEPRVFDAVLTESEHLSYHNNTVFSFMNKPWATYRCDDFCNDTAGAKIWDRTTNLNDLEKADRSDTDKYPTFVDATDQDTGKYSFDLVDDYVTFPTLPTAYTMTVVTNTPQEPLPVFASYNDSTLKDLLDTEGAHWGWVNNLIIHDTTLNQLQLNHAEYQQQYLMWRRRAYGAYHRLITEGTAQLCLMMDDRGVTSDLSTNRFEGRSSDITRDGGVEFPNTASHIIFDDHANLRMSEGTISIFTDLLTFTNATYLDKDGNLDFKSVGSLLAFNTSSIFTIFGAESKMFSVVYKDGEKPRFFVNGEFIGLGNLVTTVTDSGTNDLYIGNSHDLNDETALKYKHLIVCDKPLSDYEISALYWESLKIEGITMEAGSRIQYSATFTAAAVDVDITPNDAFQLIDVVVNFNTLPATAEDLVIEINDGTTDWRQETQDPSLWTYASEPIRFDKRFADGQTIKIDYTNTDGRTIDVQVTYQLDPSV